MPPVQPRPDREAALARFLRDRRAAHAVLFRHRHPLKSSDAHGEMIDAWHSAAPKVETEGFRGFGKSTIGEEVVILRAAFREFRNALVIGASEPRAMERVDSIKHEIETNEILTELFGDMRGTVWSGHKAELSSGLMIQAVGVGQSLRGVKYRQWRPDFVWIDDIEDEESVRSPEARAERLSWLYNTLLPALRQDGPSWVRMTGNRLDADAVIAKVAADAGWLAQRFPVRYRGKTGAWESTWPELFPVDRIEKSRAEYERMGNLDGWEREYMSEAVASEKKIFKAETLAGVVRPRVRTWEPTWAMFDPARTANQRSATTGKAVWSWVGRRLVVWESSAKLLLPDQQIADIFDTNDQFRPVQIGVEEDGLNEFILQPLRHEQLRRHQMLPLRAMRAPRGKLDFIASLYPFFAAGEVEFAKDLPDLKAQLLSFPTGRIDAPNALAYAPLLRPGQPIYEDFAMANVAEELSPMAGRPAWLCMSATSQFVTGILAQFDGGIRILADWVEEGDPGQVAARVVSQANLEADKTVRPIAPPFHFGRYGNVGLAQAVARIPGELRPGVDPARGREALRGMLRQQTRGLPAVLVSQEARWTLNALSGGYARSIGKDGAVSDQAEGGFYRTLMEGLESFAGLLGAGTDTEDREDARYREGRDGRRYLTTMPSR